jgi:hypothetical protein
MAEAERLGARGWVGAIFTALLIGSVIVTPFLRDFGLSEDWFRGPHHVATAVAAMPILVALVLLPRVRSFARSASEVVILGALPGWGLVLNHLLSGHCQDPCGGDLRRAFAEPFVWGTSILHVLVILAYAISRRRPGPLPARVELAVHAALGAGIVLYVLLAIQIARLWHFLLLLPLAWTAPVLMPVAAALLFATELATRLRARGLEASRAGLRGALLGSPLLLGLHAVLMAIWFGRRDAALAVLTETCTHAFSRLPLATGGDCHYLCTVAARGHPWLVGPERIGIRRGAPIVVNRQLAVANAFEDLLHERWPRFGTLARRIYDRLGLPVSRWIRWRWLADLVYLAMKPAEWLFLVTLLLLDPRPPEERIARMYRA